MRKGLNDLEIEEVKSQAREKLGVCRKANDIIGTQIFSILGIYVRVIYYPFGVNAPWGFTRIWEQATGKPFMAMNVGCMKDYMDYTPRTLDEIMSAWQNERILR